MRVFFSFCIARGSCTPYAEKECLEIILLEIFASVADYFPPISSPDSGYGGSVAAMTGRVV
jgi:hypothetical protein